MIASRIVHSYAVQLLYITDMLDMSLIDSCCGISEKLCSFFPVLVPSVKVFNCSCDLSSNARYLTYQTHGHVSTTKRSYDGPV
jgi:hypothetical protein